MNNVIILTNGENKDTLPVTYLFFSASILRSSVLFLRSAMVDDETALMNGETTMLI